MEQVLDRHAALPARLTSKRRGSRRLGTEGNLRLQCPVGFSGLGKLKDPANSSVEAGFLEIEPRLLKP